MELTEEFVQQIRPSPSDLTGKGRQRFYRDSRLTGFALRVSSGGTKSYVLERRIRGKVKRITLGRCDKIPFLKAQARAKKLIAEVERENTPRIIRGQLVDADIDLITAYNDYLKTHADLSEPSLADYQRSMDSVLQDWQRVPVRKIRPSMVLERHKLYAQRRSARCNNAMRLLRAVLNHVLLHMKTHEYKPIIRQNPVDILSRRKLWHPVKTTTYKVDIGSEELKKWWYASLQLKRDSTRDLLQALLLTGLPYYALSGLRYDNIDHENATIHVTANPHYQKDVTLPLARQLCNQLRQRQQDKHASGSDYVFPGTTKDKPIGDPRTAIQRIESISGLRFGLKDLGRAFFGLASQAGAAESDLNKAQQIYRHIDSVIEDSDIDMLRRVQDKVFLTVFFVVGAIK